MDSHPSVDDSAGHQVDPAMFSTFSIDAVLSYAYRLFKKHWGQLSLFMLLYMGVTLVGSMIPGVGSLIAPLAVIPLTAGCCASLLRAERHGSSMDFMALFDPFRSLRCVEVTLAGMLAGLATLVGAIPLVIGVVVMLFASDQAGAPMEVFLWIAGITFAALGMLVMWYIQIRVSMTPIICVDRPPAQPFDPIGPIKASWAMTDKRVAPLMVVNVCLAAVTLASVLALCVGYFLVAVQGSVAVLTASYLLLLPEPKRLRPYSDESVCPQCGYDLSAIEIARCPECGHVNEARLEALHDGTRASGE